MTKLKIAISLVDVAMFAGVVTAHAADYNESIRAYHRGDYTTALPIFRQLADQGNARAQGNLGVMCRKGQGVPQDYVQEHIWFNLAAAQGEEEAGKWRNILAKQMTPAQIAEAQKLAREWKPKNK